MSIYTRKKTQSRIPALSRRLKKRWVAQFVVSIWACVIIWGLMGTGGPWGDRVRNFVMSVLSAQNDWTPAIQEVLNLKSGDDYDQMQMVLPVSGIVVKNYGWYLSETDQKQKWHGGIDIKAQTVQPVKCAAAGTVQDISGNGTNGYNVTVKHNQELSSIYGNLGKVLVAKGQEIKQGEPIGEAGKNEVHFEIRLRGTAVDPLTYLRPNRNNI